MLTSDLHCYWYVGAVLVFSKTLVTLFYSAFVEVNHFALVTLVCSSFSCFYPQPSLPFGCLS